MGNVKKEYKPGIKVFTKEAINTSNNSKVKEILKLLKDESIACTYCEEHGHFGK